MSSEAAEDERQNELLSEVFHLISQPMTALQCSLEFALHEEKNPEQCRGWIVAALESSERLRCRLSMAREMAEAASPMNAADTVELRSVLQEALEELHPLFDAAGTLPQIRCEEMEVLGERSRLLRAFLYVLEHLSISSAPESHSATISVDRDSGLVAVRFLQFVLRANSNKSEVTSELEIAKRTFESAGGGLLFFSFSSNDAFVRVFLRQAQVQLDLYDDAAKGKPATRCIGKTPGLPQVS